MSRPLPGAGITLPAQVTLSLSYFWRLLAMLGLRLGEYPSTEGFQRYPRGRQPAYGNKGCSWSRGPSPGGPLSRLPLSRLVQSRPWQRPSGGSWFTFPSPLELRQGCSGLQPQPFASSSFERLVCLSSSKEKERGGGDRNEQLAAQACSLGPPQGHA